MVSRKAGSRDATGRLCSLVQLPRLLEIRRMRYRSCRDPEASGGKRRRSPWHFLKDPFLFLNFLNLNATVLVPQPTGNTAM
jgi:hypothetical protein